MHTLYAQPQTGSLYKIMFLTVLTGADIQKSMIRIISQEDLESTYIFVVESLHFYFYFFAASSTQSSKEATAWEVINFTN